MRRLSPEVAEHLSDALAVHFGAGDLSLSEVQTVCLRLWLADDPDAMLAARGVQGVLEDYLGEALDAFPPDLRGAAIALLSQMVTSAGTRNVMSAEDLMQRVLEEDDDIPRPLLETALERLESESRLVRRERRRDLFLYEITSEFLLPWIRRRREEFQRMLERHRERRRIRRLGAIVGILFLFGAIVAVLAVWALNQRSNAEQQAEAASTLALASSAEALLQTRPDVSLELALAAFELGSRSDPRPEVRNSMIAALANAQGSGATGILHGHTGAVGQVAFQANGRTVVSSSDDGTTRLWNTETHRQMGTPLTTHRGTVFTTTISPDGRNVATATFQDDRIRVWDLRTQKARARPLRGQNAHALAFSPDVSCSPRPASSRAPSATRFGSGTCSAREEDRAVGQPHELRRCPHIQQGRARARGRRRRPDPPLGRRQPPTARATAGLRQGERARVQPRRSDARVRQWWPEDSALERERPA